MKKKKIDYLYYEARFWFVKTLDLADFRHVIIYLLAFFSGNMVLQTHLKMSKKTILDQIWRTALS